MIGSQMFCRRSFDDAFRCFQMFSGCSWMFTNVLLYRLSQFDLRVFSSCSEVVLRCSQDVIRCFQDDVRMFSDYSQDALMTS